ncbi:hypothetical protein [Streptomyces sp. BBFR109]|uniref:hypothetical protein n=1 Tax=Streptomyces sp. BBFR109 TaxID=3448172 RepID=UPI003F762D97
MKSIDLGEGVQVEWAWEKLPLDLIGVGIFSVGGERPYGRRSVTQIFDLECRGPSDLIGYHVLEKIGEHFADEFVLNDLPAVPDVSDRVYEKCRIVNMGSIQNLGLDANDRVIFKLTGQIIYRKG